MHLPKQTLISKLFSITVCKKMNFYAQRFSFNFNFTQFQMNITCGREWNLRRDFVFHGNVFKSYSTQFEITKAFFYQFCEASLQLHRWSLFILNRSIENASNCCKYFSIWVFFECSNRQFSILFLNRRNVNYNIYKL